MERLAVLALAGALALTACAKSEPKAPPATGTPTAIVSAAPMTKTATCAPAPSLDESQDFSDPRDEFTV
ncbi:MAG: hypothetical protein ACXWI7_07965, partial [Croceibacterium sp.]